MRKFGNQPLYPDTSFGGAGQFKNTKVPSSLTNKGKGVSQQNGAGEDADKQAGQVSKRRMKAFSTPKPLTTTLDVGPISSGTNRTDDEDDGEGDVDTSFSAYASFLNNEANDENLKKLGIGMGDGSRKKPPASSIRSRTGGISFGGTSTSNRVPSSIVGAGRRGSIKFNPPLVLPATSMGQDLEGEEGAGHRLKSSSLKKQRPQPFLPTNQESDNGFINVNPAEAGVITKSFQPLSRRANKARKDSITQEYVETSASKATDNGFGEGPFYDNKDEVEPSNFIRRSDIFGNDVIVEKAKAITFDFVGSAKSARTRTKPDAESNKSAPERELSAEDDRDRNRGKKLFGMLRLDPCDVELFRLNELDYEKYMSTVRTSNCLQATTQTFDDGMEEETQTDPVDMRTKWTQKPIAIGPAVNKAETIGVGDGMLIDLEAQKVGDQGAPQSQEQHKDREKLNKFLSRSCRLMLAVLSQKSARLPTGQIGSDSKNQVKLNKSFGFLDELDSYSLCSAGELIACCNGATSATVVRDLGAGASSTIVTVWTWREPSVPIYFLRVFSPVTSMELKPGLGLMVIGCKDASISCYNLREHSQYHSQEDGETIRAPSVNTSCWTEPNHESPVVGVSIVPETKNCAQFISLDKERLLICWSLFLNARGDSDAVPIAESVWSKLKLKIRTKISLLDLFSMRSAKFLSLQAWKDQSFSEVNLVIATNAGCVARGVLRGNAIGLPASSRGKQSKEAPPLEMYLSGFVPSAATSTIVDVTSFDIHFVNELILASFEDGFCRLFRFGMSEPFLVLNCSDRGPHLPFKVRWSKLRSSMFYVGYEDRLEFWDLLRSDVTPAKQIQFNKPGAELQDLEIFNTNAGEFIAILTPDGLSIGSPPTKVEPLSTEDDMRFQTYIKNMT